MATLSTCTFSLFLLSLSLITLTATARPCKTIFFYTTATTTSTSSSSYSFPQNPNPNWEIFPSFPKFHTHSPKFLTFFLTTVDTGGETRPHVSYLSLRRTRTTPFPLYLEEVPVAEKEEEEEEKRGSSDFSLVMPLGSYSSVTRSSIGDRTKDIMSVVGALLFGVGCGALTAATMFLIWSLFSPNRFDFDDSDDSDEDDDGYGDGSDFPKKIGYIAIPDDLDAVKKKNLDFSPQKEVA